jgi:hypothetical protein
MLNLNLAPKQRQGRMPYRLSSNVPFLEPEYPLSGAIDIGISHSLYNQAAKKGNFL